LHGLIIGLVAKDIPSKEWSDRLSYRDKQISLFDLYRRYSFILCQLKKFILQPACERLPLARLLFDAPQFLVLQQHARFKVSFGLA
jgi:hypothetical protein